MSHFRPLPPFDTLVAFHREDPQGYEKFRSLELNWAVITAPAEHRAALTKTLHLIEATRQSARSELEAATLAHALMAKSLTRLAEGLHELHTAGARLQTTLILDELRTNSHSKPG